MTGAYRYADGDGLKPHALQMADFIERFGLEATFGRRLYAREIYAMNAAVNVYNAKLNRKKAEDWRKWSEDNPKEAEMLVMIDKLVSDEDNNE